MTLADIRRKKSSTPEGCDRPRRVVITGGCGFIGTNLAHRLAAAGRSVCLLDNLSRPGVEDNLEWLRANHGGEITFQLADVRDRWAVEKAVAGAEAVFHFAAQVAVTTSLEHPVLDFEINAQGTLNVLEALRAQAEPPPMVFTSTNKVYGDLANIELQLEDGRYRPSNGLAAHGIGEDFRLDFHSPYGCSKGAADQYVRDYARVFGLPAVVLRMSCIYGPHQRGNEDQGWVAHFVKAALAGGKITLFGDGHQVRDVLFVEDLVEAMLLAEQHAGQLAGQAFNIGGGPDNAVSLLQVLARIGELAGEEPRVALEDWRPADQRYYVSDTRLFQAATGWRPRVTAEEGVARLYDWMARDLRSAAEGRRAS
ncbi:MAG TPA: SDR family NAD(P)-dependent oxidoreductase [Thermoanaerobaculia bacterium]|nr:SDR family NAD(P)-dependent oxidoreductase [Thermoanaerobaculia bacterium]